MKIQNKIVEIIDSWDLEIFSEGEMQGVYMVRTEVVVIAYHLTFKELRILFHASMSPSDSATMALEFSKIKGIKEVISSNVFVYDKDEDNVLIGEDATKEVVDEIKGVAIEKFMKKQFEIQYLMMTDGARC